MTTSNLFLPIEAVTVMDYFKSRLPLWFAPRGMTHWAVTLGQRTWYSVPRDQVTPRWMAHEDCHKRQYARAGVLRFLARYLGEYLRNRLRGQPHLQAYRNIRYEIEARAAEDPGRRA